MTNFLILSTYLFKSEKVSQFSKKIRISTKKQLQFLNLPNIDLKFYFYQIFKNFTDKRINKKYISAVNCLRGKFCCGQLQ